MDINNYMDISIDEVDIKKMLDDSDKENSKLYFAAICSAFPDCSLDKMLELATTIDMLLSVCEWMKNGTGEDFNKIVALAYKLAKFTEEAWAIFHVLPNFCHDDMLRLILKLSSTTEEVLRILDKTQDNNFKNEVLQKAAECSQNRSELWRIFNLTHHKETQRKIIRKLAYFYLKNKRKNQ